MMRPAAIAICGLLTACAARTYALPATPTTTSTTVTTVTTTSTTMTTLLPEPEPYQEQAPTPPPTTITTRPPRMEFHTPEPAPAPPAKPEPTRRERIVQVALGEVGQAGDYTAGGFWCVQFAAWVYQQAGADPLGTTSPLTLWALAKQTARLTDTPQPGDIMLIDLFRGTQPGAPVTHAGIVTAVEGGTITTVEGNAADNPDQVSQHTRPADDPSIVTYRALDL